MILYISIFLYKQERRDKDSDEIKSRSAFMLFA